MVILLTFQIGNFVNIFLFLFQLSLLHVPQDIVSGLVDVCDSLNLARLGGDESGFTLNNRCAFMVHAWVYDA